MTVPTTLRVFPGEIVILSSEPENVEDEAMPSMTPVNGEELHQHWTNIFTKFSESNQEDNQTNAAGKWDLFAECVA